jgi:hypothetical protein
VIDDIALRVAQYKEADDLEALIASKVMDHVARLKRQQPALSKAEIDRITSVVVSGVLKRLAQIAEGGGQIGSA